MVSFQHLVGGPGSLFLQDTGGAEVHVVDGLAVRNLFSFLFLECFGKCLLEGVADFIDNLVWFVWVLDAFGLKVTYQRCPLIALESVLELIVIV